MPWQSACSKGDDQAAEVFALRDKLLLPRAAPSALSFDNDKFTHAMVHIQRNDNGAVSEDEMSDITNVVMNALHTSFDGKTLDAATLGFTLALIGMAVLKNAQFDHVKRRLKDFIDVADLSEIESFTPGSQA